MLPLSSEAAGFGVCRGKEGGAGGGGGGRVGGYRRRRGDAQGVDLLLYQSVNFDMFTRDQKIC